LPGALARRLSSSECGYERHSLRFSESWREPTPPPLFYVRTSANSVGRQTEPDGRRRCHAPSRGFGSRWSDSARRMRKRPTLASNFRQGGSGDRAARSYFVE
jgi:hypothetical protein